MTLFSLYRERDIAFNEGRLQEDNPLSLEQVVQAAAKAKVFLIEGDLQKAMEKIKQIGDYADAKQPPEGIIYDEKVTWYKNQIVQDGPRQTVTGNSGDSPTNS